MSETCALSAAKLSAGYGQKVVVSGIELTVRPGEVLTLIGPNGAGKSTVLKTIAAQLSPVSGTVLVGGSDLSKMKPDQAARHISALLTERIRTDRMTCKDVVSTGRYPYTGRLGILSQKDREIAEKAMVLTGVAELGERDFSCISDGQRQCVMLARAIAQQPEILILDEPVTFLDISRKLMLLSLVRTLARDQNIAVIQSLHEIDLAQKFSDRILCVSGGQARFFGTPDEVFSSQYISDLYGISEGSYNALLGTAEAAAVKGKPEVFVIGGGGSGIPVYRQLQRKGIPFAAGVIHENDIDYPVAKALAAVLITERAFEPVSEEAIRRAREVIKTCRQVICCLNEFGTMNQRCASLLPDKTANH